MDFTNMCRICLSNCDIIFPENNIISNIYYKLCDVYFTSNELPQQICRECNDKIYEIYEFSNLCKQSHSALINCLNDQNNIVIKEEILDIKIEKPDETETVDIKTEFCNDESNQHQVEHRFQCDQCPRAYQQKYSLLMHKRKHSGERPYKCNQCDMTFAQKGVLTKHERVHSDARQYKCDQCTKSFFTNDNLIKHKRMHSVLRPFKCEQCTKQFSLKWNLIRHRRSHSGERPHVCDQCPKAFYDKRDLARHKLIHIL